MGVDQLSAGACFIFSLNDQPALVSTTCTIIAPASHHLAFLPQTRSTIRKRQRDSM